MPFAHEAAHMLQGAGVGQVGEHCFLGPFNIQFQEINRFSAEGREIARGDLLAAFGLDVAVVFACGVEIHGRVGDPRGSRDHRGGLIASPGQVSSEKIGNGRIGLDRGNIRQGMSLTPAQYRDSHMGTTVDDSRRGCRCPEIIDPLHEDVLQLTVERGPIRILQWLSAPNNYAALAAWTGEQKAQAPDFFGGITGCRTQRPVQKPCKPTEERSHGWERARPSKCPHAPCQRM